MKALVKYASGDGNVELQDVPVPVIGPDEVLIKVSFCGICGSDIHIIHDEFTNRPPVIMGHEFSGVIAEVGPDVSDFKPSDRVVSELHTGACGVCRFCTSGNPHICPSKLALGSSTNGAFAEYVKVPAWLVHKIPDSISFTDAALTEPTAISVHCVLEESNQDVGKWVVVIGPGPIGLLTAQVAKSNGKAKVIMFGTPKDANRMEVACQIGIDKVLDVTTCDVLSEIENFTGGEMADFVVEASGSQAGITNAVKALRRQGKIVFVGMTKKDEAVLPWNTMLLKDMHAFFPFSSAARDWQRAIRFIAEKKVNVAKLISNVIPLTEWKSAFDLVEKAQGIKVLIDTQK